MSNPHCALLVMEISIRIVYFPYFWFFLVAVFLHNSKMLTVENKRHANKGNFPFFFIEHCICFMFFLPLYIVIK